MFKEYLQERYNNELSLEDWEDYLSENELSVYETDNGFVTYKLQGDAALIHDMYVKPDYRKHTHAWELHNHVLDQANQGGKRVMLTFSDFYGNNHLAGIKAMRVAGFIPAFKTMDQFVFIKGI